MWTTIGARLLSLIMGLDVYECCFAMSYVLVGGAFDGSLAGGLACWWFALASSITGGMIGARLIIFKIHIKGFGVLARSLLSPSCRRCF